MDPRTFLPPRSSPTSAKLPRPAERAPRLGAALSGGPTVVTFLRHVGCPFAEATFRDLRGHADRHPEVHFVAVSHAPEAPTRSWCSAVAGGPGAAELVVDPQRKLYAEWGLGTTSLSHFLGRRSLASLARLARRGIRNRHPSGTRWQGAGTFAVDADGVIRWVHVPRHAGALPDLDAATAAAAGRR